MMFLNNLMNSRNLTRAELSACSNIPESTLRDILNGKAQLDRCAAVTLYNLAYALDVSVVVLIGAMTVRYAIFLPQYLH